jgi:hypothetical protein
VATLHAKHPTVARPNISDITCKYAAHGALVRDGERLHADPAEPASWSAEHVCRAAAAYKTAMSALFVGVPTVAVQTDGGGGGA